MCSWNKFWTKRYKKTENSVATEELGAKELGVGSKNRVLCVSPCTQYHTGQADHLSHPLQPTLRTLPYPHSLKEWAHSPMGNMVTYFHLSSSLHRSPTKTQICLASVSFYWLGKAKNPGQYRCHQEKRPPREFANGLNPKGDVSSDVNAHWQIFLRVFFQSVKWYSGETMNFLGHFVLNFFFFLLFVTPKVLTYRKESKKNILCSNSTKHLTLKDKETSTLMCRRGGLKPGREEVFPWVSDLNKEGQSQEDGGAEQKRGRS